MSAAHAAGGAVVGTAAAAFGRIGELLMLVFVFLLLDYITGILAAANHGELSSGAATRGLYKKSGFIIMIALGFALDTAISALVLRGFALTMPFNLPFGLIMCAWVIFAEAISVTENLHRLGVYIPTKILKFLKISKEKWEEE